MKCNQTMGHEHNHAPANFGRAFAIGIALNLGFVILEVIYGRLSNSLALVADAGHNLSDVLGLALAWGAAGLVGLSPTKERTYGVVSVKRIDAAPISSLFDFN